jgi:hypothetical protein
MSTDLWNKQNNETGRVLSLPFSINRRRKDVASVSSSIFLLRHKLFDLTTLVKDLESDLITERIVCRLILDF